MSPPAESLPVESLPDSLPRTPPLAPPESQHQFKPLELGSIYVAERPIYANLIDQYIADPTTLANALQDSLKPGVRTPEQIEQIAQIRKALDTYPWQRKREVCGFAGNVLEKEEYARGILAVLDTDIPSGQGKDERVIRTAFLRGTMNTMYAPLETVDPKSGEVTQVVPADVDSEVELQHELIARALEKNPTPDHGPGQNQTNTVQKLMKLFNSDPSGIIKKGDFFHWSCYLGLYAPQRSDSRYDKEQNRVGLARQIFRAVHCLTPENQKDHSNPAHPIPYYYKYLKEYEAISSVAQKWIADRGNSNAPFPRYPSINAYIKSEAKNIKKSISKLDNTTPGANPIYEELKGFDRNVPLDIYTHISESVTNREYDTWNTFFKTTHVTKEQNEQQRLQQVQESLESIIVLGRFSGVDQKVMARIADPKYMSEGIFLRSVYWYSGRERQEIVDMATSPLINIYTRENDPSAFRAVPVYQKNTRESQTVWIPKGSCEPNVFAQALKICASKSSIAAVDYQITYGGRNSITVQPYPDGSFLISTLTPSIPAVQKPLEFYTDVHVDSYTIPDEKMKGPEVARKYDSRADFETIICHLNRIVSSRPDVYELLDHPTLGKFAERAVVKPSTEGFDVIIKLAEKTAIYPDGDAPRVTCHIKLTDGKTQVMLDDQAEKDLRTDQKDYLTWLGLRFFETSSIVTVAQREKEVRAIRGFEHVRTQQSGESRTVEEGIADETAVFLVFIGGDKSDGSPRGPSQDKKNMFSETHFGWLRITLDDLNSRLHARGEKRNRTVRVTRRKDKDDGPDAATKRQELIDSKTNNVVAGRYNPHLRRDLPPDFPYHAAVAQE
ncbi:MAG: hypothetical protein WCO78_04995 [Candidatus Roizmanbacteria bacterium]